MQIIWGNRNNPVALAVCKREDLVGVTRIHFVLTDLVAKLLKGFALFYFIIGNSSRRRNHKLK